MEKLTEEQENSIKERFLNYLGDVINQKRKKKNISQEKLAEYLGVTNATISRYESGKQDMPVSTLPLISTYCQFPLTDYFLRENVTKLAKIFSELIYISVEKSKKPHKMNRIPKRQIKAYIIQEDDKEYIEPAEPAKEKIFMLPPLEIWERPENQGHLYTDDVDPFSSDEIDDYIMLDKNEDKRIILESAGNILRFSQNDKKARTMKKKLADFVIADILKENDISQQKRLVAYYRELCKNFSDCS